MSIKQEEIDLFREKYLTLKSSLNEKGRRLWAAVEAQSYGRGGITLVPLATIKNGLHRQL